MQARYRRQPCHAVLRQFMLVCGDIRHSDLHHVFERRAKAGDTDCATWMDAFSLNVAKYIASLATTVEGRVDVILLTGGTARSKQITDAIRRRIAFIAPVEVYAGENELESLAENGYNILAGTVKVHRYDKNRLVEDN